MQEKKIAIYARKSKITTSGNSIDQQIASCKRYAQTKFFISEDDFLIYVDEGLSGFYSDRPNYQKMLSDIHIGCIKAVICYKIDRISRKTTDLLNFIEELKTEGVAFIACSDEIDTETKTGKMMLSLLASIAEFERDIIAERISDNMLELAKDGHWLGGNCPTGYSVKKETVMQRGKKIIVNYLQADEDTAFMVDEIFKIFLVKCSLTQTVDHLNQKGYRTVQNKLFERHGVKNILQNPVYAKADEVLFEYMQSLSIPILTPRESFDGEHGLMVYNKTRQEKIKNKDKGTYRQRLLKRPLADWIVALGRHPGLICGSDWVMAQKILSQNQNKYCRSHLANKAYFSGKIICSDCGAIMYVRIQSGRSMQDGSACFYYVCSRKHKDHKLCPKSANINGNNFDPWLINQILKLDWFNTVYKKVLTEFMLQKQMGYLNDEQNYIDKQLIHLKKAIQIQIINLRSAPDEVKGYIYEDLQQMQLSLIRVENEKNKQEIVLRQQEDNKIDVEHLADQFINVKELFESATIEKRRLFLNRLLNRIELRDKNIHVYM